MPTIGVLCAENRGTSNRSVGIAIGDLVPDVRAGIIIRGIVSPLAIAMDGCFRMIGARDVVVVTIGRSHAPTQTTQTVILYARTPLDNGVTQRKDVFGPPGRTKKHNDSIW